MTAYTVITNLLQHANQSGEGKVILDVAERAGLAWVCSHCRCDNLNDDTVCEHCGTPTPGNGMRPNEWQCVCMASNWGSQCRVCHRPRP